MDNTSFLEHLQRNAFDKFAIQEHQVDLQGWMCNEFENTFETLIRDVYNRVQRPLTIIEVGTWKGLSACTMASLAKRLNIPCKLICVDTWLGAPEFWTWGLHDLTRGG
jgi:predicted O-methyltransferase YrrM